MKEEGVIKFNCNWIAAKPLDAALLNDLNAWRDKLHSLKFIGVTADGIGYGNMSIRHQNTQFIITGSGTGKFEKLTPEHYTLVTEYNIDKNSLTCFGPVKASSESLTHAMIYECCQEANAVFHVHDHSLWKKLLQTHPSTNANVPYGTPEMAYEIRRLFNEKVFEGQGIFAMGGHEDGVIAFATTTGKTGKLILS